jgi:hypothetical protein
LYEINAEITNINIDIIAKQINIRAGTVTIHALQLEVLGITVGGGDIIYPIDRFQDAWDGGQNMYGIISLP